MYVYINNTSHVDFIMALRVEFSIFYIVIILPEGIQIQNILIYFELFYKE